MKRIGSAIAVIGLAGLSIAGCGSSHGGNPAGACYKAMRQAYAAAAANASASPAAEPAACKAVPAKTLQAFAGKILASGTVVPCSAQVAAWQRKFTRSGIADDYKQLAQALAPHPSNVVISGLSSYLEEAAQSAQAIPVPKCADPDEYWAQFTRALWAGARSDNNDELIGDAVGAVDALKHLRAEFRSEGYSGGA